MTAKRLRKTKLKLVLTWQNIVYILT